MSQSNVERSHTNPYLTTPPNALREEAERTGIPRSPLHERVYGADVGYRARPDVGSPTDHTYAWVEEGAAVADHPADDDARRRPLPIYPLHAEDHTWGYPGAGPAQLALDILLDALDEWPDRLAMRRGDSLALLIHQDLKTDIIAKLDQRMGWRLHGVVVEDWMRAWKRKYARRYDNFVLAREEVALLAQMRPFEELLAAGDDLTPEQRAEWQRLSDRWDDLQGRYVNEHEEEDR